MDGPAEVYGVVVVIVLTTVLSGPAVGVVDLTPPDSADEVQLGQGYATVGDVTLPSSIRLVAGSFGSGSYYLKASPAKVELLEVRGQPLIDYSVSIDELGFSRSTIFFVTAENEGQFELTLAETSLDPDEITNESYDGSVSISLRHGHTERTLAESNVTIAVIE